MGGGIEQPGNKTSIVVPLLVARVTVTMPAALWAPIGGVCRRTIANFMLLWLALAVWLLFLAPPFEIAPAGVGRAVLRLLAISFGLAMLRTIWSLLSMRKPGQEAQ